jgi:hypothetical protein
LKEKSEKMSSRIFLMLIIFCCVIASCKHEENNNLMPELAHCDSAAIMYYHEPGKPRFFNMAKEYDKAAINALAENVNGPLIKDKDTCTSEGKIYAYGKGEEVYVVYFNKSGECNTLSFIKTGEKYFVKMNDKTKKWLDDLQKRAKEPGNELQD